MKSRWPPQLIRDTDEGSERYCRRCEMWWPMEPAVDADGQLVRFWRKWMAHCYACELQRNTERLKSRRAA